MTLFFFEQITEQEFVGPVIVAADDEGKAWELLSRREGRPVEVLRQVAWQVAQELREIPSRPAVVYPSHYRRAILS